MSTSSIRTDEEAYMMDHGTRCKEKDCKHLDFFHGDGGGHVCGVCENNKKWLKCFCGHVAKNERGAEAHREVHAVPIGPPMTIHDVFASLTPKP